MSLINQMLKDLDARKQQGANSSAQEVEVVVCHPPRRSRYLPVLAVLIVVLVVGAIGSWWWLLDSRTAATTPVPLRTQAQINVEPVVIEPQPVVVNLPAVVDVVVAEDQVTHQAELSVTAERSDPIIAPVLPDSVVALADIPVSSSLVDSNVAGDEKPFVVKKENHPPPSPPSMVIKPPSLADQAQQLRLEGRALIQQQQYHFGAQLLNQALQIDHNSAQPWQELVRVCVQAGDLPSAMDAVTRGCEAYPNDIGLRVYRARLIVETGDYPFALTVLQTGGTPSVVASSDYYALLASVLQQLSRFAEAEEQYALLTTAYPQRGDWWIGRAICADQLGSAQQAMAYYQQAITCRNLSPQLKQFALKQLTRLGKG